MHEKITSDNILETDLIMCFDVLIHQSNETDFKSMVKSMVEKAKTRLIIGAYNQEPKYTSNITHFYNGIFDEIKQYNKFDEIAVMATYRDVSVVVATRHKSNHQRDISSSILNTAFLKVKRPDLLQFVVDVSRKHFGFFTSHYPRVFEYTWLLEQLEFQKNGSVLDLGAGVCPLPLCLAENNWQVTTVDAHTTVRKEKDKAEWNEWGFLDYGSINPSITSKNINFSKFKSLKSYNCIYSISVIEHMPKKSRVQILKKTASLLKKGGMLLLTIDLIPNTNNLWNFSENKEVESIEVHGNIDSFSEELKESGFEISEVQIQRDIPDSRTDLYYVKAVLRKKPIFSRILPSL
jgi:2-polyprenyl-3-methyl-5-hydroxy-6-metoxy-1,4-benzoquinol methylase